MELIENERVDYLPVLLTLSFVVSSLQLFTELTCKASCFKGRFCSSPIFPHKIINKYVNLKIR